MGGIDAYIQKKDILTGSDYSYKRVTDGKYLYNKETFEKGEISKKMIERMDIKELPVTDEEFSITIKAPNGTYIDGPFQIAPKGEGMLFNTYTTTNKVLKVQFYGNLTSGRYILAVVKQPYTIKGQYFYPSSQKYSSIFMFLNYIFK